METEQADPERAAVVERIRNAAVRCFGAQGFGASVRSIATAAGVSPALVIHYFGSKDALRAACDEHVLRSVRDTPAITGRSPADFLGGLTAARDAVLVAYVVQALLAGGELATAFLADMIADVRRHLDHAQAQGQVRPSRDPAARARLLVLQNVGALLVHLRLNPPGEAGPAESVRALSETITLPALEIYTDGLLTERRLLDSYLRYVTDPPSQVPDS
ncbi:TetR family transcriptional regulator [Crossiella sp. CA-258035]|uniref:TetR/AcrR family transcriptional regulator n=1 Tax=Crossiella sp. CA-258035 TaxID=2981138 RepID=UPI0024BD4624|nr:TetR family transcriptional regulator [Crossiella sp. CA-258035]WHT20247.1 TetR family transcriptional regulator [Crossiella sp. CA-258035]